MKFNVRTNASPHKDSAILQKSITKHPDVSGQHASKSGNEEGSQSVDTGIGCAMTSKRDCCNTAERISTVQIRTHIPVNHTITVWWRMPANDSDRHKERSISRQCPEEVTATQYKQLLHSAESFSRTRIVNMHLTPLPSSRCPPPPPQHDSRLSPSPVARACLV